MASRAATPTCHADDVTMASASRAPTPSGPRSRQRGCGRRSGSTATAIETSRMPPKTRPRRTTLDPTGDGTTQVASTPAT